jgi:release factor glutamine methyltransferase
MLESVPRPAPASLIERERRGPLRALLSALWSAYCRLSGLSRYDDHRLERIAGTHILVLPSVANPRLLRTGAYFAAVIDALALTPDTTVLDMGTGSGVCALRAVRRVRHVVAVDVNPAAVRCARINAAINQVEDRIDCRVGDLFEPLGGERFDLVLFNPPFLVGEPRDARDAAWRSQDGPRRFAAGLAAHLTPRGQALLLLSSFGDASARFEAELRAAGFALAIHARRRYFNETLTVLGARGEATE